ncbi:ATP-binding protein [Sulfurimonas sp. NW15]|uniref:HP0729 family protein n=1 Tax=Sulfurimonas sp. NW15 TaxID=2922729 RepID=UPI003DA98C5A
MKNILVLYNPYYQENVIEQHLEILKNNGSVAFGKLRSKLRDYEHPSQNLLNELYSEVSQDTPLQLFLTDYNSMYVAHVVAVKEDKSKDIEAPKYYDEFDVEKWYIIDDLRLIVSNDFQLIRDNILANFLATNFNNRTYAIYGNKYVYPMQVTMKEEINYFEKEDENFKYYTNIFKSDLELEIKQSLIDFSFGVEIFYSYHANTQDNVISAEIEYLQNKHNTLYDFSSVVIKYSKAVELELHRFMKILFQYLTSQEEKLQELPYTIQGNDYRLADIQEHKANYGTYKYLIKNPEIKNAINNYIHNGTLRYFIFSTIPYFIKTMQNVRNESVHGASISLAECTKIRDSMLGIGKSSFLGDLIVYKKSF